MKTIVACVLSSLSALAACHPPVSEAVSGHVPKERAQECRAACGELDMRLQSVVLIMNSAGCVCVPEEAPPAATPPGGAEASAGGAEIAAVIAAEEAARQRANTTVKH